MGNPVLCRVGGTEPGTGRETGLEGSTKGIACHGRNAVALSVDGNEGRSEAFGEEILMGRNRSGIKGVCRANPATPDLPRPATPVGVSKGVTFSEFRYVSYAADGKSQMSQWLFRDTNGVTQKLRRIVEYDE